MYFLPLLKQWEGQHLREKFIKLISYNSRNPFYEEKHMQDFNYYHETHLYVCLYTFILYVCPFLCWKSSPTPWFMRPPLRCGECWTGWAVPPAQGRNVWSEATASQTLLWSAARQPAALQGQRSPQKGLCLHLQTKGHRWKSTLHLNCTLI